MEAVEELRRHGRQWGATAAVELEQREDAWRGLVRECLARE